MKYQNIWKRMLCVLLAVCSLLSGINFNQMETSAKVNEKKLYMDYMPKIYKKWRKEMEQRYDPQRNPSAEVSYKILDLDDDGRKELIYMIWDSINGFHNVGGWICTIKKGKVHKVWSEESSLGFDFYRIKGEKNKLMISGGIYRFGGVPREIYNFSSGKMKKEREYFHGLDPSS